MDAPAKDQSAAPPPLGARPPRATEAQPMPEPIQDAVAKDLSTVPLLQGAQVAVVGKDVKGTEDTLDASFKFRYGALSNG